MQTEEGGTEFCLNHKDIAFTVELASCQRLRVSDYNIVTMNDIEYVTIEKITR